jgi:hypothetical protein
MTLPTSGPLLLGTATGGNSINSEYGYGNDMASYLGAYYGLNGVEYRFPVSGNPIAMNLFYGTNKIAGGTQTLNSSQSFVIPVYNTITITVVGGAGGTSGNPGAVSAPCGSGATTGYSGGNGGLTSFGGYASASGGAGGAGSTVTNNPGAAGSTSTVTFTNPIQGGSGPSSGTTISAIVGAGGAGGGGGALVYSINGQVSGCNAWSSASAGAAGAGGHITITWA